MQASSPLCMVLSTIHTDNTAIFLAPMLAYRQYHNRGPPSLRMQTLHSTCAWACMLCISSIPQKGYIATANAPPVFYLCVCLLQDTPQDAISGGRPGSAARSGARSGGRTRSAAARSAGTHQADSRMSPATDEENSNIMLLLDAAEELHKTASHDGPEPSTAATNGMLCHSVYQFQ